MKCRIINIGDELLLGQVVNTNASEIAQMLNGIGVEVTQIEVVGDDLSDIVSTLIDDRFSADVVIISGGLGPTRDDVTKHALVEFFETTLEFNQVVYDRLVRIIESFGRKPTEGHKAQCFMPATARLLENQMGTAPGMHMEKNGTDYYIMPGVPYELLHIMEERVVPEIESRMNGTARREYRTMCIAGLGESDVAHRLTDIEDNLPGFMRLAYLPKPGIVRVRLFGALEGHGASERYNQVWNAMLQTLDSNVYATTDKPLAKAVGEILLQAGQSLSVAESCTGGYLGHMITAIPGSSAYFKGGGIVYSNELKMQMLGVPEQVLMDHGAVSRETVEHLVRGAVERFGTTYAIAISGVAGPDGGTPEKPVGTVWICAGNADVQESRMLSLSKDRLRNIELSAVGGLNILRKFLRGRA